MSTVIKKEENGTYTVRVWAEHKDVFGTRRSKYKSGIKTSSAAYTAAGKFQTELNSNRETKDYKFSELCDLYQEAKKDKKAPTTIARQNSIILELKKYFKNIKAKDVSSLIVQDYINKLARTPLKSNPKKTHSRGTQEKVYNTIRAILNWAVRFNLLEHHKVCYIDFVDDDDPYEPNFLEPEIISTLLIHIKKNYNDIYLPVLLCSLLGLRRSEALGLKWENVDFISGTLLIKSTITSVDGKIVERNKTKNTSSRRRLTMPDLLYKELESQYETVKELGNEYVCMSIWTGVVPSPQNVTRNFQKAAADKKIKATLKDLRFSLNQILIDEDEVDLFTQADILGHSNLTTTRKHYSRQSLRKTKNALDLIADKIFASTEKD